MEHWENRTVWITGATSGIGKALAELFLRKGARVICSARNRQQLERIFGVWADSGRTAVLPLDVSDLSALEDHTDKAEKIFGGIDLLINNAGVSQRSLLQNTDIQVIENLISVDLTAQIILTRCVLPGMLDRGAGHIAGVSSIVGRFGSPLRTVYSAAKHGLHGFYDSLRAEVWDRGINVTLAVPGFVRTDISLHAVTGDGSAHGKLDKNQEKGISAERCAADICRGIEMRKSEVYTGLDLRARLALILRSAAPALLQRIIRNADVL